MFKFLVFTAATILGIAMITSCRTIKASAITIPDPAVDTPLAKTQGTQTAVLAGGCFWGVEAVFEHVKGVTEVRSGYSGGAASDAQYEKVGMGETGHAESVQITYDPSQVSYGQLLKVFFSVAHDPTQKNRQGPDVGTQYRSAIFYTNPAQKETADAYIRELNNAKVFAKPIATEVVVLPQFFTAEAYHQKFAEKNPGHPYIASHDLPKLRNLKGQYPEMVK